MSLAFLLYGPPLPGLLSEECFGDIFDAILPDPLGLDMIVGLDSANAYEL